MNLYQINSQIQQVVEAADDNGEINAELFDQLQIVKEEKQLNVIKYIKHLENEEELFDKEIERIKKLKQIAGNRKEWLKKYLENSMRIDGRTEIDYPLFKAKIRKNPPRLTIADEKLIPEEFKKQEIIIKIDKDAIKDALKSGKEIAGCALEQNERLEIK